MKKAVWFMLGILLVGALALTACGGGGNSSGNSSNPNAGTHVTNRASPPADFANMKNPVAGDPSAVTAGKDIFSKNCQTCHGADGQGDGPSAASLNPKPANLTFTAKEASDQYIHWVISEGGAAANLNSAMPSFKGTLSDQQIWQVTEYVKSLK